MKGVVRFGKKEKLNPRNMGPYGILQMVGKVVYELKLHSELSSIHPVSHVSMHKKYNGNPSPLFLSKILV